MRHLPLLSLPTTSRQADWQLPNLTATALHITHLQAAGQTLLVTTKDTLQANQLKSTIEAFGGSSLVFPDHETLPYDPFSPHQRVTSERLAVLSQLLNGQITTMIVAVPALMQRLCPPAFISGNVFILKTGMSLQRDPFRQRLEMAGYRSVAEVVAPGEFSVRGAVIDLYPMGFEWPVRLDYFDNEIDSLRTFNPDDQRTLNKIDALSVLPAREFDTQAESIQRFRQKFRESFAIDPTRSPIYQAVSQGHFPPGIEAYLPLFFETTATLFDYLPAKSTLIGLPGIEESALQHWQFIQRRYESYRHQADHPLLEPERLFITPTALSGAFTTYPRVQVHYTQPRTTLIPPSHLTQWLESRSVPTLIVCEGKGRREAFGEKLKNLSVEFHLLETFNEALDWAVQQTSVEASSTKALAILAANFNQSFSLTQPPLEVISEYELLGIQAKPRHHQKATTNVQAVLDNIDTLSLGDPVVHIQHGVGRYAGLELMEGDEFLILDYANGGRLYVPVMQLDRLSRYQGTREQAPWHKLGSEQWEKACRKAQEKAFDAAAELLNIYAAREAAVGTPITLDKTAYAQFADSFPFEETRDQQQAIEAIEADLAIGKMDRVICGDVGFGKTEVAMRAAFLTVMSDKQVAMLAPTTLLAEQHAKNFADRFADWPIKIAALSRFQTGKHAQSIIDDLKAGHVDIVIGTHKLLSDQIEFKQLGLLIIDEEHRFGVRHKEAINKRRSNVNLLTMTATPIPRTLNLSLSGIKSLSLITTPPEGRLAVKTFVNEWNDALILEALEREFQRGGQVYFLHNDVASIDAMRDQLAKLCPSATINVAHGQMRERELEQVMQDFYHQRINVLLCTTIIESGIDIPNANTILIHRADKLGLAQLHQLRGRVGRSHHRAYCYLITPPFKSLTTDAQKRLTAISEHETLGAGFMLANQDLEIRGAGEFLGESQSGQIDEVGFTLYMQLLKRAVDSLKKGEVLSPSASLSSQDFEINLHVPALIPETYLPDIHSRLVFYKRMSSAEDEATLDELQIEMIDRFGLMPEALQTLFKVSKLRCLARPLGLQKIEATAQGIKIHLGDQPNINVQRLIQLVQTQPKFYQLQGKNILIYKLPLEKLELRLNAVREIIEQLIPPTPNG